MFRNKTACPFDFAQVGERAESFAVGRTLVLESNAGLEVAAGGQRVFFHVGGVHPEDDGVMVGILEPDQVHFLPKRNLMDEVQLQGTNSSFLQFFSGEAVHDPVYITAVVYVMVDVHVAIAGLFLVYDSGAFAGRQDV